MKTELPVTVVCADSVTQLKLARRIVAERFTPDAPLTRTALHLIDWAADVVSLLPEGDLESACEARGSARAAVVPASYAIRQIHDVSRTGRA